MILFCGKYCCSPLFSNDFKTLPLLLVIYQALVRCAEDVIHTLAEILPFDGHNREHWVLDLERLKEKLHSAVHFILQTLRAVSSYHNNYNKASSQLLIICKRSDSILIAVVFSCSLEITNQLKLV